MSPGWRIGVDVGGTFADCVAAAPDGSRRRIKLLTDGRLRAPCVEVPADAGVGGSGDGGWLLEGLPAWCAPALVGAAAATEAGGAGRVEAAMAAPGGVRVRLVNRPGDQGPVGDPGGAAPRWIECSSGEEAPVFGARLLTGTPPGAALPPLDLRIGTTRGTNALLEGELDDVVAFVNEGLEGLLAVGTQQRLGLFDLVPRKPPAVAARIDGVRGRIAADGSVLEALDEHRLRSDARVAHAHGLRHAAVALIHAWRNRTHEDRVADILREEGFARVVVSADMSPAPRLVPRAQTAAVDAALTSAVRGMLDRIRAQLGDAGCTVGAGTSAGGIVDAARYLPKESLLSGPALGCAAALAGMRAAGIRQGLTFDMGGTSTDVARLGEEGVALRSTSAVAGIAVASPAVDVHSVAAGGGSICRATATGLFVGPQSAGAAPGPACYGRGGPLTITDVNLLLGRIVPRGGGLPLDRACAQRAAEAEATAAGMDCQAMLRGFLSLANEHMASAVRTVCAAGGHDPRQHALVVYGGAGGQHACAVADALGMRTALVLAHAGFVSGLGALEARHEQAASAPVLAPLGDGNALALAAKRACGSATAALLRDGFSGVPVRASAALHLPGHAGTLEIELDPAVTLGSVDSAAVRRAFAAQFERTFGRPPQGSDSMVEEVRVIVAERAEAPARNATETALPARAAAAPPAIAGTTVADTTIAGTPTAGTTISGPAVLSEEGATIVVDAGWTCTALASGALLLERIPGSAASAASGMEAEGLAAARFSAIATWMGALLERTARSVNVKDRLDFSCGVLDADGLLCANAPHVPVHLGALGVCVRALESHRPFVGDEVVLTNHPAFGGSHLPDLTVARAVHDGAGTRIGFVAARAHHAEIGGTRAGSMPPDARNLQEEGVVIPPMVIATAGQLDEASLRAALATGPWPSRDPDANVDDVRAAIAALDAGAAALQELARTLGTPAVRGAMLRLLERSAARTRALAARVPAEGLHALERLDDGTPIAVAITRTAGGLRIDFTGSGPVHPGAFNAPAAVVRSALLYVLRLLAGLDEALDEHRAPLNEGFLQPVEVVLPPGFLNPPFDADPARCPPVFAGNTETSQRVVDALLSAFGVAAASQGTMNNLVLGGSDFSVYETIGGGSGACAAEDGASAVHVHMTNTRITDPETLELRLERLQVRHSSGGAGTHRGGDGIVRCLRVLRQSQVCFTAQRRAEGPSGAQGGSAGATGQQCILRADGSVSPLGAVDSAQLAPGDAVEVRTPGGGGFGSLSRV